MSEPDVINQRLPADIPDDAETREIHGLLSLIRTEVVVFRNRGGGVTVEIFASDSRVQGLIKRQMAYYQYRYQTMYLAGSGFMLKAPVTGMVFDKPEAESS